MDIIQVAYNSTSYLLPDRIISDISDINLGLEIVFLKFQVIEDNFINYEIAYLENLESVLIGVVTAEFIAFFISTFLYWKLIDVKLKKKLIESRLCFDHFPVSLIMKQTYIMKYLQETSSSLLK